MSGFSVGVEEGGRGGRGVGLSMSAGKMGNSGLSVSVGGAARVVVGWVTVGSGLTDGLLVDKSGSGATVQAPINSNNMANPAENFLDFFDFLFICNYLPESIQITYPCYLRKFGQSGLQV
jgi:hypothetical protein